MKLQVSRYSIQIIPEDSQDEAYIEEVLGCRDGGAEALAIRVNAISLGCLAYIQIKAKEVPKDA